MFDNLLFQNASAFLIADINNNRLPSAMLFAGPEASGKLTCALELARVLSCTGDGTYEKGHWLCQCNSCRHTKELSSTNLILTGSRDCTLEILAAKRTLLYAGANNSSWMNAARYLFVRSVRKLTLRFSQILWEDDPKLSKVASLIEEIDEELEKLDIGKELPENSQLEEICNKVLKASEKLEAGFMYDSIPIEHIRKASFWAHMKAGDGKKVLIFENVEKMNDSSRNALLKILEEPPQDVVFILTTTRRGAVMPTILSRVRTYNFIERTAEQQRTVISRVFHKETEVSSITQYLQEFLPVTPAEVKKQANVFWTGIESGHLLQIGDIVSECGSFEPRQLFTIFLRELTEAQKAEVANRTSSAGLRYFELEQKNLQSIMECYNSVFIYNQKIQAALENLYRELASNKRLFGR